MTTEQAKTTILLVDDEPQVRRLTRKMLELDGYAVLESDCASEALEVFEQNKSTIQMLISDIQMPGTNGIELAVQIEQAKPDIPVLLITGYAGKYDNETRHPILGKPFSITTLRDKVSEVLNQDDPCKCSRETCKCGRFSDRHMLLN